VFDKVPLDNFSHFIAYITIIFRVSELLVTDIVRIWLHMRALGINVNDLLVLLLLLLLLLLLILQFAQLGTNCTDSSHV
jgi:hypothetical protein